MRNLTAYRLFFYSLMMATLFSLGGCGTKTGDPGTGTLNFSSKAFATSGFAAFGFPHLAVAAPVDPQTRVAKFLLCLANLKFQTDSGDSIEQNGSDEINYPLGLIDLSDGGEKVWGSHVVPVNFMLKKITAIVKPNPAICGTSNSINFNSKTTSETISLKWNLAPPINLTNGTSVSVSLANVVSSLRQASDGGSLHNDHLKSIVEATEDSAEDKK